MTNRFKLAVWRTYFGRYLIVGGLAFITEYVSFLWLFHRLQIALVWANGLSFCFGLLMSFICNRVWTFATKDYHHASHKQFTLYVFLALFNLLATLLLVSGLKYLGLNPTIGKLLAMVVTSLWNFWLYRRVIFKHTNLEPNAELS